MTEKITSSSVGEISVGRQSRGQNVGEADWPEHVLGGHDVAALMDPGEDSVLIHAESGSGVELGRGRRDLLVMLRM